MPGHSENRLPVCEALTYRFVMAACVTLTNTLLMHGFGPHNLSISHSKEVHGAILKEVLGQKKTFGRVKRRSIR